jgi:VanZ family protein
MTTGLGRIAWRGIFFLLIALVIWLSVKAPGGVMSFSIWDKLQHFLAYAVLGGMGVLCFPGRVSSVILVLGLVLLGIGLEVLQFYVPGRDMSLGDGVANLLGVIFGVGSGYWITQGRVGASRGRAP